MTDEEKIIKEEWASGEWEAKVKAGENVDDAPADEKLTKDLLDAEQRQKEEDAALSEEELQKRDIPLPQPTLITLAAGLASQAMTSMGAFPNPLTGKHTMLLNQASHLVDTIDLLYEKTQGNRTSEESKTLENILHELRMIYLAAEKEAEKRKNEKEKSKAKS
ncbi:MAG: DUF1844 domain-containing protein [Planctomycetaceae bacterium]|jgi:hypothetical protein|nr:DUF1844 domain-containing protein [Planctomycetaceae bacterium]